MNQLTLTKRYIPSVKQRQKPKSANSATIRILLTSLFLSLVSACAEPISSENNKKQPIITDSKSIESSAYGREAIFSYPAFSGTHNVGSLSLVMTDYARSETFKAESVDRRKLQIRFFYPTHSNLPPPSSANLPVINKISWQYLIGHQEIAGKRLRFGNYQEAFWDVSLNSPISATQQNYPVLVFSHGYGYNTESYTALLAELASKGYIVVAINHSYGANPTDLGYPGTEFADIVQDSLDTPLAQLDIEKRFVWAKQLSHDAVERYLPIWSEDQSFVIEQLVRLNSESSSVFYQKLDLVNLGLFGHSYGGAAAFHTAAKDNRVKAVIDIDGTIFNHARNTILQPFALFISNQHQPKFNFSDVSNNSHLVRFNQFTHASFTDHILWWQWDHDDLITELGSIEALRAVELTTDLIDDFFTKNLLDQPSRWFSDNDINNDEITIYRK